MSPPTTDEKQAILERTRIAQQVPHQFQQFLLVGLDIVQVGYVLMKRGNTTVHALADDLARARLARQVLSGAISLRALVAGTVAKFDCILIDSESLPLLQSPELLQGFLACLTEFGQIVAVVPNGQNWQCHLEGLPPTDTYAAACQAFRDTGLVHYNQIVIVDSHFPPMPTEGQQITYQGRVFDVPDCTTHERLVVQTFLILFSRPDYNVLHHADHLMDSKQPARAYRLLESVPVRYLDDEDLHTALALGMVNALLARIELEGLDPQEAFSASGRNFIYMAMAMKPTALEPYQFLAEFWQLLGDKAMAVRSLRLIAQLTHDDALLARLPHQEVKAPLAPAFARPPMDVALSPGFRALLITSERPHYSLDVLYDGLLHVLGAEHIDEYPWKPLLHGATPEEFEHYPCTFDHPGNAVPFDVLVARIRAGYYDCIFYGDVEKALPEEQIRAIGDAAAATPIFLVDGLDDFVNTRDWFRAFPGFPEIAGYLKREMLHCIDYGPNTHPMTFAYDRNRGVPSFSRHRSRDFFWAGRRMISSRRAILEAVESRYQRNLDSVYDQVEYTRVLRTSTLGLNLFGVGYDTVRYWELPANGCMLLSERLPIYVPYNFEDGVSAVFFDDLTELLEKLDYYCTHQNEALDIAERGFNHYCAYHTNTARALQTLGWVQTRMAAIRESGRTA